MRPGARSKIAYACKNQQLGKVGGKSSRKGEERTKEKLATRRPGMKRGGVLRHNGIPGKGHTATQGKMFVRSEEVMSNRGAQRKYSGEKGSTPNVMQNETKTSPCTRFPEGAVWGESGKGGVWLT